MGNWNHIANSIPPDKLLEVMDEKGNTGFAYPTYYHFKIIDKKVVYNENMESKWDGGWMIQCEGLTLSNLSKIIGWRHLTQLNKQDDGK